MVKTSTNSLQEPYSEKRIYPMLNELLPKQLTLDYCSVLDLPKSNSWQECPACIISSWQISLKPSGIWIHNQIWHVNMDTSILLADTVYTFLKMLHTLHPAMSSKEPKQRLLEGQWSTIINANSQTLIEPILSL